ncbi:helix-turn-helix transcriptional regulator [Paenibacillus tarimensis]|uniref:helix-turn-helix transcriptional regulator n=1 Tax=Paenibacillus tarimensis TaxID=416012 RepID=UPI001F3BD364|nr:AraC family transcriptional regulator [Paenibacillus tarimensis]MCF2945198.1 AraC family transcriptional regulator [Paenibacillus tarimensis]
MSCSPIIQRTIEYIEKNLHEELTLESVAQFAGFSKFHYHRVFHKEVGVTASEYIRYRRIANAANMLLYTDEKILDIAFYYRFESQESFTRSFKKYYRLPPGQYRRIIGKLTMQREETGMNQEQVLKGWNMSGSHPANYKMGVDREVFHKGNASGFLKSVTVQSEGEFATMMQQFKADKYAGKRLKLSGFLKAKAVNGFCGFWMRVDDSLGDVLQFDNMSDRPVTGDQEWNQYSIVLDVPANGAVISFGVLLSGSGTVWIDELKFEEVGKDVPTTNIDYKGELREEPVNLSFED